MKKYSVSIEEFDGKIYTDFRRYGNETDTAPDLFFTVEIEPRKDPNADRYYLDGGCNCRVLKEQREKCSLEIPITEIEFTYYLRSVLYADETGQGKPIYKNLLAVACVSCFLFAQFRANVSKDSGENVSNEIKRLSIFL